VPIRADGLDHVGEDDTAKQVTHHPVRCRSHCGQQDERDDRTPDEIRLPFDVKWADADDRKNG
jgi:hypothetical protein